MTFVVGQRVRLNVEKLYPNDGVPNPCFGHVMYIGNLRSLGGKPGVHVRIWQPLPDGVTDMYLYEHSAETRLEAID